MEGRRGENDGGDGEMRRRKSHTHRRKEGRRSKGERMAGPEINGFFGPLGTKTHQLVIHKMRNEKRGVCPHTLPPLNPPHTPSFSLPHTLPHCIFFSFFTLILQFSFFLLSPFKSTRYLAFFCLLSLSFFFPFLSLLPSLHHLSSSAIFRLRNLIILLSIHSPSTLPLIFLSIFTDSSLLLLTQSPSPSLLPHQPFHQPPSIPLSLSFSLSLIYSHSGMNF